MDTWLGMGMRSAFRPGPDGAMRPTGLDPIGAVAAGPGDAAEGLTGQQAAVPTGHRSPGIVDIATAADPHSAGPLPRSSVAGR